MNTTSAPHITTRYEWLNLAPYTELQNVLYLCDLKPVNDLAGVVERQSLENARQYVDRNGKSMAHGITGERKNFRRGIVGDRKNVFTDEHKRLAFLTFGRMLLSLEYEKTPLWWCSTQERNETSLMGNARRAV